MFSSQRISYFLDLINKKIQKQLIKQKIVSVPINKLICQIKPFSEIQGFSGRSIEYFPPYNFFNLFKTEPDNARKDFANWLEYCLITLEAWKIPKTDGGWANGTLCKLILDLHKKAQIELTDFNKAKKSITLTAIELRVNYYFSLYESIKNSLDSNHFIEPIVVYEKEGVDSLIIFDGHHRTSILKVLDESCINVILKKE